MKIKNLIVKKNCMHTYWDLSQPSSTSPICSWGPFIAFENLNTFFEFDSGEYRGFQRKHSASFRRELFFATQTNEKIEYNTISSLKGLSSSINEVIDLFIMVKKLNLNKRISLASILCNLGFYENAVNCLYGTTDVEQMQKNLIKNIIFFGKKSNIGKRSLNLYSKTNSDMIKFYLLKFLIVYYAQRKNIKVIQELQKDCKKTIQAMKTVCNNKFTTMLNKSKFYRASSYTLSTSRCGFSARDYKFLGEALLCRLSFAKSKSNNKI